MAAKWAERAPEAALEATQEQTDGVFANSHTNATSKRWHLWEIDLRCAPGLQWGEGWRWRRRRTRAHFSEEENFQWV